jgi:hypothetical protein
MILDFDALLAEANAWLLDQRSDRALCPCAIAYFKARFCLPQSTVDRIRRDEAQRRDDERGAR